MRGSHADPRRPPRSGHRGKSSLLKQALRRCFPHTLIRHALYAGNTPAQRHGVRALLCLLVFLLLALGVLLHHLLVSENTTITNHLHVKAPNDEAQVTSAALPITSADPADAAALKKRLLSYTPQRTQGPQARESPNGFQPSYFDPEERLSPPLTKAVLEAWAGAAADAAEVPEPVLLQHAWPDPPPAEAALETSEADEFFHLLSFLHPPTQQRRYYREAMNDILGFGTRVGGADREPLLHHLLNDGLGRSFFDAATRTYRSAPHLSQEGRALLEQSQAAWPASPSFMEAEATKDGAERVPGWRWSLMWDNFTAAIPLAVEGRSTKSVTLQNLVFQFPGGSQFRRRQAAVADNASVFVGHVANPDRPPRAFDMALEVNTANPLEADPAAVYTQETFLRQSKDQAQGFFTPDYEKGPPGTTASLFTPGVRVPLKPSLAAPLAQPVSRQPVQHAVYAAHWDSMFSSAMHFLGACDSAVPMVFLLRTIKTIAVLTDVAEVAAASYARERMAQITKNTTAGTEAAAAESVPGVTTTFRKGTTEAELRTRLATLLSPAHHALLYKYYFARPYTVGDAHDTQPLGGQNHSRQTAVDVRMWLDWVQHLPALSMLFFDGEEAFHRWEKEDNTYGSRHLARRWRELRTTTQTRYSGGPQSLFSSVDLFALYDLMGPAGLSFHNFHPTQSGIYYAALAQKEFEQRRDALRHSSLITAELLWLALHASTADKAAASVYLRQLGASVDVAMGALHQPYVAKAMADNASRPAPDALPRSWLLYGAPHEMLTLHRLPLLDFITARGRAGTMEGARVYDRVKPQVLRDGAFDHDAYQRGANRNIFFDTALSDLVRRNALDPVMQDDHLHWLDTQRVLHLIPYPFPRSWHKEEDDGRDVHDGTTVDLANVLWSTVLELGHYWTGEGTD